MSIIHLLAFESSCDDTSAAILKGSEGLEVPQLISLSVQSQDEVHARYGGVVPELASRAHLYNLIPCVKKVLQEAGVSMDAIDIFAATSRPGLVGSLLVGHTAAKTLALVYNKPFISCDHLEGHLTSPWLEHRIQLPSLALIVSGGHTSLYRMKSMDEFECLGQTLDDAIGEAFDKGAQLLGLGFPGGAHLERLAQTGDHRAYHFGTVRVSNLNFSFSGLKSELARHVKREAEKLQKENLAASYQYALLKHLLEKVRTALETYQAKSLVLVGGVARNQKLRDEMSKLVQRGLTKEWFAPSPHYCTDNAAMIGLRAFRRWKRSEISDLGDDVRSTSRPPRMA